MRDTSYAGNAVVLHCYNRQVFVGKDGGLEVWSGDKGLYQTVTWNQQKPEGRNRSQEAFLRRNYVDKVEDSERGIIRRIEGDRERLFVSRERLFVSREDVEGVEIWERSDYSGAVFCFLAKRQKGH